MTGEWPSQQMQDIQGAGRTVAWARRTDPLACAEHGTSERFMPLKLPEPDGLSGLADKAK